jgi:hypothetical protein
MKEGGNLPDGFPVNVGPPGNGVLLTFGAALNTRRSWLR